VIVVGGAGVFGSRLVRGLVETTDAEVLVAGRDLGRAFVGSQTAGAHGALAIDRSMTSAAAAVLRAHKPDLVIDAAGPFQGADLSFARAAIAAGVDYLDLADGRDFVAAFPGLDKDAKAAGVRAACGASSTPALSHAALDAMTAVWRRIDVIRAGISPGNRAPRGKSVIEAILSWAGGPVRVFADGDWTLHTGWGGGFRRTIEGLGRRRFALAETPDLDLMVSRYAPCHEALFFAGLELALLHDGLGALAALRRAGVVSDLRPMAAMLQKAAGLFEGLGSDVGGMFVEAFGRDGDNQPVRAEWTLVAPAGVGPFVPTLPALALARKLLAPNPTGGKAMAPGAQPCVGMLTLDDLAGDFARLGITTRMQDEPLRGPFETALGDRFALMPEAVRASHRAGPVTHLRGEAEVLGATGLARLAAGPFGFPGATKEAPTEVVKRMTAQASETWERRVGRARFRSRIAANGPGRVTERFGPFTFDLAVEADATGMRLSIKGWRIGPLPMPAFLAPRSDATERVGPDGAFTFDVPIAAPLLGRLTHYKGWLRLPEPPHPPHHDETAAP